jgi:hypothetical protein
MKTKIPNLGECSIDSLKIRIELSELISYDPTITKTVVSFDKETGEQLKEFKECSKRYFINDFSFYVSIVERVRVGANRYSDCIMLLINSKQIGSKYFEGLTLETLPIVFDLIKEVGILDCNYSTFLLSAPSDIDFKKDYELPLEDYKEMLSACSIMTKPSSNRDKGFTPFNKGKFNLGVSWSVRKTSKYLTNPHVKIYHKGYELMNPNEEGGSKDFKDRYLSFVDTDNIIRIESTIKNKKHLESLKLGLKTFTLQDLLSLSVEQKDSILSQTINCHLLPRTKNLIYKNESELTPVDSALLSLLVLTISNGKCSFERALKTVLSPIKNNSSKTNMKKKIIKLYNDYVKGTDYDKKSSKIENILDGLGWF